jgi:hypothetical protein
VSVGVNVTFNVCCPALNTVPAGGEYTKLPATVVVAFNCAELNAVP